MIVQELIFYVFSIVMVLAAGAVITVRNPVYAALFLVLTFFTAAAIWMLLEAEFLAIVLVVVYVGAVMVLFLFVVMMLDINVDMMKEGFIRYLPVALVVAVAMAAELLMVIWSKGRFGVDAFPVPPPNPVGYSNTRALGELLYTEYLLPFEVAGVILLVAIIAAIALTLRKRTGIKTQDPAKQVRTRRDESVRLVKMKSEKPQGMLTLAHFLTLGAILFSLSVAGIFINRKNVIILLMCLELMLLAVNMNFVAFSRFVGNLDGQVFVFFILTVAAAEAAIGLAIVVVLFRNRRTINVAELDDLKG